MTTEYTGRGDPARSMALLWGAQRRPTRGPRPGLSVEQIVRAAIDLVDADGLAALSMRRVAERLGVGTMSLYTYVPGKAELLDVMLDTVLGESVGEASPTDGETEQLPGAGAWRVGLERLARQDWALYQRHPWVLAVSGARALLGPNELDQFEAALRMVDGLGLSAREMIAVVSLVAGYVRGAAQRAADARYAEARTGISEDQWWTARAPLLDQYLESARFPTVMVVAEQGGFTESECVENYTLQRALDDFEFGLQRVLDGVEALVRARAAEPPGRNLDL
jgi:AcrR family transcriptional regulator